MPVPSLNMIYENRVDPTQNQPESNPEQDEELQADAENIARNESPILSSMYNRISLISNSPVLVSINQFEEPSVAEFQNTNNTNIANSTESTANVNEVANAQSLNAEVAVSNQAEEPAISSVPSSSSNNQHLESTVRNSDSEEIPEGVDPSFLEALPPEMRREVLEQHRLLRLQQRISMTTTADQAIAGSSSEVSPEFLAALPPALQEEVLTQQRLEQQRQAAARANPDEPVDAGAFFETLQPSLRTMVILIL